MYVNSKMLHYSFSLSRLNKKETNHLMMCRFGFIISSLKKVISNLI